MAMKSDSPQHNQINKQPYEPPKAAIVPVQLEERVLGCNFSTIKYCGLTE
jgi:hypothetical protein